MKTFLLVAAGVVAGLLFVALLAVLWLKRKFRGLGEAIASLAQASDVPPFRITLQAEETAGWGDADAIDAVTRSFEAAGYQPAGDFLVPEMEGVALRAFWHPELANFAAVTAHPEAGYFVDLVRIFRDRTLLTVTTAGDTGLDLPPHATRIRSELDPTELETIGRLHEVLVEHSAGRDAVRKQAQSFAQVFVQLHAMEMDTLIARGGPSREEILRVAELGGIEPPDDDAICLVQTGWRASIEMFVDEQVQNTFLAHGNISAADWERQREELVIVHEQRRREDTIEEVSGVLAEALSGPNADEDAEDRVFDDARERVAACFEGKTIRAGFRAALELFPEKKRYEALGSVDRPWPADFYIVPDLYGA